MTIEEASVNINNPDLITAIKSAIVCTNTKDTYSSGFRNGLRYVITLLTNEEPKYEDAPKQEAVEPGIAQDVDGIFATCGNCTKKLWKMMGLEFVVNPDEMPRFCPHCGQAVKWE